MHTSQLHTGYLVSLSTLITTKHNKDTSLLANLRQTTLQGPFMNS